ncbi:MAG: pseudouridine-5'-phosphate glycosidase, partial [Devosia sp.]
MSLTPYLTISDEVAAALNAGAAVVALESTIITHGMPYPQNLEMARGVEEVIRPTGAAPAPIDQHGFRELEGIGREWIDLGAQGGGLRRIERNHHHPRIVREEADGARGIARITAVRELDR